MAWADTKDEGMPPNAVGNRSHDSNTRGPFVERRLTFELSPIAPFCLEFTVWGLRRRPQNQVDRWDGTTYQRVISIRGRPAEVRVSELGSREDRKRHVWSHSDLVCRLLLEKKKRVRG